MGDESGLELKRGSEKATWVSKILPYLSNSCHSYAVYLVIINVATIPAYIKYHQVDYWQKIWWGCLGGWLEKKKKQDCLNFSPVWPLFTQESPLPLFGRLHSRPHSKHRVCFLCKQCYKWRIESVCFENSYLSSETKKVHSPSIGFSSSVSWKDHSSLITRFTGSRNIGRVFGAVSENGRSEPWPPDLVKSLSMSVSTNNVEAKSDEL